MKARGVAAAMSTPVPVASEMTLATPSMLEEIRRHRLLTPVSDRPQMPASRRPQMPASRRPQMLEFRRHQMAVLAAGLAIKSVIKQGISGCKTAAVTGLSCMIIVVG